MSPARDARPATELGAFLRSRRDRLSTEHVGLTRGQGIRRTPGLRREDLAALAGISIDYYIRLILEGLRPFPAYVTNRIGKLVAWNPGRIRMLAGIADWPAAQRNIARFAFLHPGAREVYADWEAQLTGWSRASARSRRSNPTRRICASSSAGCS